MTAPITLHELLLTEIRHLRSDASADRTHRTHIETRIDKLEAMLSDIKFEQEGLEEVDIRRTGEPQ